MINPTAEAVRAIAEHHATRVAVPKRDIHQPIDPSEVGVSLLGERLLAAARLAAALHAQAAGIGAVAPSGAER